MRRHHFKERTIHIHRAWQGKVLADQVKSLKRVIPVSDSVLAPLAAWREDSIRTRPVDLVFCYEFNGQRLGDTWWRKHFAAALDEARIERKGRNISGHSLRHSLHTHLLSLGAGEAKLRGYFGWSERSSAGVLTPVQAGYTHWSAGDMRELVPLVEQVFGGS